MVVDSPRVLICRMSAVGDTILTLPVACAIRRRYPKAFIAWAVERKSSAMVLGHACIDEVIVLERGWYVSPRQWWQVRKRLAPLRIDIAIDCQSVTKSALAAWLSGAKLRIGCRGKYGSELSPWLNNRLIEPQLPHVVDRSLELLAPIDVPPAPVEFKLPIAAAAVESMNHYLHESGIAAPFAIINPGASWDSKLWEMDRFGQVAKYLGERHGLRTIVVWAGERELQWAREIVAQSDCQAHLACKTNWVELAALCQRAQVFISSDTGPLHLAVAAGASCIGLYGATRREDCGPYGPQNIALQAAYNAGSRKDRRRADNGAMKRIAVDDVCRACDEILSRADGQQRGAA